MMEYCYVTYSSRLTPYIMLTFGQCEGENSKRMWEKLVDDNKETKCEYSYFFLLGHWIYTSQKLEPLEKARQLTILEIMEGVINGL